MLRSRWRRLGPGHQALPALVHLRNGDTPTRLAAGVGVGAAPPALPPAGRRPVAATAPNLARAMAGIARHACAILDGTLVRTDRIGGAANTCSEASRAAAL